VASAATVLLLCVVENLQMIACDFASSFICGYKTDVFGSLSWQRTEGFNQNKQTYPNGDATGSVNGSLKYQSPSYRKVIAFLNINCLEPEISIMCISKTRGNIEL
jgi:hypothetical protein